MGELVRRPTKLGVRSPGASLPKVDAILTSRLLDKSASLDEMRARIGRSFGQALEAVPDGYRPAVVDALANRLAGMAREYERAPQPQKQHALGTVLIAVCGFFDVAHLAGPRDMPELVETVCATIQNMVVDFGYFKPRYEGIRH